MPVHLNYLRLITGGLGLLVSLLIGLALYLTLTSPVDTSSPRAQPQWDDSTPVRGGVTTTPLFIYACFSCPFSAEAQPVIADFFTHHSSTVAIIWKDLPLRDEYPQSWLAHRAARCAQRQDAFWRYADALWPQQADLSTSTLLEVANQLELDQSAFTACLESTELDHLIERDLAEADALAIPGTPYFYAGGHGLSGLVTREDLEVLTQL